MPNWQHDPALNYSYNLLQDTGKQQYDTGKGNTAQGMSDLNAPTSYFRKLLSGDPNELMSALNPELDNISTQFNQVRRMISDQPRGGGKTSVLASMPAQQIGAISNLYSGARRGAAGSLVDIAGREAQTGLAQTGMGMQNMDEASGIAQQGRQFDSQNSWKSFFKNMAIQGVGAFAGGVGGGLGMGLMKKYSGGGAGGGTSR